jgi:hypothetical protein
MRLGERFLGHCCMLAYDVPALSVLAPALLLDWAHSLLLVHQTFNEGPQLRLFHEYDPPFVGPTSVSRLGALIVHRFQVGSMHGMGS